MAVWSRVTTLKGMRRLDAGFTLKVRPTAYPARLSATSEGEKRSQAFDLSKSESPSNEMKSHAGRADGGGSKCGVVSEMRSLLWTLVSVLGSQWTYYKDWRPVLRVSLHKYSLKPCSRKGLKVGFGGRGDLPPMPLSSLHTRYNRISYFLQSRLLSAPCPFCTQTQLCNHFCF